MLRTSSYNPQSNGAVECLHHSLKVSLPSCLISRSWMEQLLGPSSASTCEDFGCSAMDLVFHHSPLLPRELFQCPTPRLPSTTLTHYHSSSYPPPVPLPLESSRFIPVLTDSLWTSLQPLYSGPFWILHRFPKWPLSLWHPGCPSGILFGTLLVS